MNLTLKRHTLSPTATIGLLSIDGVPFAATLEDKVRGPKEAKIFGKTAIPAGRYGVIINRSTRFSALAGHDVFLPLLLEVPGYEGVRIHPGNSDIDTHGCVLVGTYDPKTPNWISASRDTFARLLPLMQAALKRGESIHLAIA